MYVGPGRNTQPNKMDPCSAGANADRNDASTVLATRNRSRLDHPLGHCHATVATAVILA